ncbi:SGNH/GDSL hydrolase family protein [Nocardioides jensenii]|uniref:SGNH/GDSL hydrolase family protein n=1 Tax=Nocardioides jensenii TaxID=1843 RepID=UPI001470833A|nr:SGNH/GDSL hydrolase family protein [Nocardioides jensenii]
MGISVGTSRSGSRWPARIGVLLVLVLASALSYAVFERATSEDLSRCQRFALESKERQVIVTGAGRRIVVIGDSYSAGLGLDDPARSWPRELTGEVHVFGFSGSGFGEDASPCGRVSYDDRAARATRGGADLVVLQGGLNDVFSSEAQLRDGVRRVLERLHALHVVVVGPVPAPRRMPGATKVDTVLAQECERAGVDYISMIDLPLDYLEGDLHLTQAGHRAFGAAVATALTE